MTTEIPYRYTRYNKDTDTWDDVDPDGYVPQVGDRRYVEDYYEAVFNDDKWGWESLDDPNHFMVNKGVKKLIKKQTDFKAYIARLRQENEIKKEEKQT